MSTTPDDPEDRMTACIPEGVCPACGISKEWSNSLCSQPWHPSREVPSAENGYGGYCMCDGTVVCGDHERLASPVQGSSRPSSADREAAERAAARWALDELRSEREQRQLTNLERRIETELQRAIEGTA